MTSWYPKGLGHVNQQIGQAFATNLIVLRGLHQAAGHLWLKHLPLTEYGGTVRRSFVVAALFKPFFGWLKRAGDNALHVPPWSATSLWRAGKNHSDQGTLYTFWGDGVYSNTPPCQPFPSSMWACTSTPRTYWTLVVPMHKKVLFMVRTTFSPATSRRMGYVNSL